MLTAGGLQTNRINVFHIVTRFDLGGAERVALNIAKSHSQGICYHLVEVVAGKGAFSDSFCREMNENGISFHRSPFKFSNKLCILLFPMWFNKLYKSFCPDIIHTHTEVPDISIFLWINGIGLRWRNRVQVIRTVHNTKLWNGWIFLGKIVERFFNKHHSNVAIGTEVARSYELKYTTKIPIINNGIEIQPVISFAGLIKGKTNILFGGRFEPQKGIATLISVIKKLSDIPDIIFHIVGEGSMREILEQSLSHCANAMVYDRIYNLSAMVGSFDYVFMPSEFEGLALMSIESSMSGVPVIANRCGGITETLPPEWPLFVDNNSVDEFVLIFRNINTMNRRRLADTARSYVLEKFSIGSMQQAYENFYYKNICNRKWQ